MKSGGLVVDQGCSLTSKSFFSPEYCGGVIGIADVNGWCVIPATMWQNVRPHFCHKNFVGFLHVYSNIKQMKREKWYYFFSFSQFFLLQSTHTASLHALFSFSVFHWGLKILSLLFNDFQCVGFFMFLDYESYFFGQTLCFSALVWLPVFTCVVHWLIPSILALSLCHFPFVVVFPLYQKVINVEIVFLWLSEAWN